MAFIDNVIVPGLVSLARYIVTLRYKGSSAMDTITIVLVKSQFDGTHGLMSRLILLAPAAIVLTMVPLYFVLKPPSAFKSPLVVMLTSSSVVYKLFPLLVQSWPLKTTASAGMFSEYSLPGSGTVLYSQKSFLVLPLSPVPIYPLLPIENPTALYLPVPAKSAF